MPTTDQHRKEHFSIAFVGAIAAVEGINLSHRVFDYGIDGDFQPVQLYNGRLLETGVPLSYQLKATSRWEYAGEFITYDLEAKAYNDMVIRNNGSSIPLVLIVLCLPLERDNWLTANPSELILRNCCYWYFATGRPTANKTSKRIQIPIRQVFSPSSLRQLLRDVRDGTFYGRN